MKSVYVREKHMCVCVRAHMSVYYLCICIHKIIHIHACLSKLDVMIYCDCDSCA